MRKRILDIGFLCDGSAHFGGGLSIVEIVATLYGAILKYEVGNPNWPGRDRFILSKGHGVLGFYPALVEVGIVPEEIFSQFKKNEADLIAHPVMNLALGIESSNGSLGQGLSMGVGLAWAAKYKQNSHRIFILLGDGECNEGSVWEAAMSAAHYKLDNLFAIVDYNKFQSDGQSENILKSDSLADKWRSFGWDVMEVDGHSIDEIYTAIQRSSESVAPRVLIAHTIKGKGVSFMENNNVWHHNRLTKSLYELALKELEDSEPLC
jgi:transketolase